MLLLYIVQLQVGGTSAADREARELRIGRLQRQKVRVSRKRILESATKVSVLVGTVGQLIMGDIGSGVCYMLPTTRVGYILATGLATICSWS
jgi:E3 ubiquitin-protein ligase TRIP12